MIKKIFLLLLCFGLCYSAGASLKGRKKGLQASQLFIDRVKQHKVVRSIAQPITGTLDPSGNTLTLWSPEDSDAAYLTISGSGEFLTDLVTFTDNTASVDVSAIGAGVYTIKLEFENGAEYLGYFEFVEY